MQHLQSVQQVLGDELMVVEGVVEDSQLMLFDTFSILEDLRNATAVRPTGHTHTLVTVTSW